MDIDEATKFAIPHAERSAEREADGFIKAIIKQLSEAGLDVDGRTIPIKPFGSKGVAFDLINPSDMFDHLEITLTCTGWGRMLAENHTTKGENDE